jgi:hypothetical protein
MTGRHITLHRLSPELERHVQRRLQEDAKKIAPHADRWFWVALVLLVVAFMVIG